MEITLKDVRKAAPNPKQSDVGNFYLSQSESDKEFIKEAYAKFLKIIPDEMTESDREFLCQCLNTFCDYFRIGEYKIPLPPDPYVDETLDLIMQRVHIATSEATQPEDIKSRRAKLRAIDYRIEDLNHLSILDSFEQGNISHMVEENQRKAILDWAKQPWSEAKEIGIGEIAAGMDRFSPDDLKRIYDAAHGIMVNVEKYHLPQDSPRVLISSTRGMQLMRLAYDEQLLESEQNEQPCSGQAAQVEWLDQEMAEQYGQFFCALTNWPEP